MRILLIILLTISFKVHAFESLFFLGKELGSTTENDQLITLEDVENINSSEEALDMYTKVNNLDKNSAFTFDYVPEEKNSNFSDYKFQLSPITGTIVSVIGLGDSLGVEDCDARISFYEKYYEKKYGDPTKFVFTVNKQTSQVWFQVIDGNADARKEVDAIFIFFHCSHSNNDNRSVIAFGMQTLLYVSELEKLIKRILEKKEELLDAEANVNTDTTGL